MTRTRWASGRFLILAMTASVVGAAPPMATADLLNPSNYSSLGASLSEVGGYQVDTSLGVMTLPDGQTITGNGGGIFTFGSISLDGASFAVTGDQPFVLLSQGDFSMTFAAISVSAAGQTPGAGGNVADGQGMGTFLAAAGGGGFGGAGGQGGAYNFDGDPRINPPWGYYIAGGAGGATYGGLSAPILVQFQG